MNASASEIKPADDKRDFITRKLEEHRRNRELVQQILDTVKDVRTEVSLTLVSANEARAATQDTHKDVVKGLGIATALQGVALQLRTAIDRSRNVAKAILLLVLLLGVTLGWAIIYFHGVAEEIDVLVRTPISYRVEPPIGEESTQISQWHSTPFAPSGAVCAEWTDEKRVVHEDPCKALTKLLKASLVHLPPDGKLVVFVTGGHDRRPLTAAFARKVGSNEQLAQLRSNAVVDTLRDDLKDHPEVSLVVVSRGATNVKSVDDNDRTVIVTLVQVGPKGSAHP
jgi:hypothetical protein